MAFHVARDMPRSPMSSELKADFEIKAEPPKRRAANAGVRLNPVPAKNTLLTVIFFSAVAAAILYWIFFPPAVPQAAERPPAPNANAQATERN